MPELKKYVSKNGYWVGGDFDKDTEPSWEATFKKAADCYALEPNTLPNTYMQYYTTHNTKLRMQIHIILVLMKFVSIVKDCIW